MCSPRVSLCGLLLVPVLLFAACQPHPAPTEPAVPDEIEQIRPMRLVEFYKDHSQMTSFKAYTNRKITFELKEKRYQVWGDEIHFFTMYPNSEKVIVFKGKKLPKDNLTTIFITGICRGPTYDNRRHDVDVNFFLTIENCEVIDH